MNALKTFVSKNHFRNVLMGKKKKKKTINVLTAFSIFHESDVKTLLKLFVNNCSKSIR